MGISALQKASLHATGVNSFARVIFLSFGRGKIHFGAQPYRTCPGNWWSEKLTSFRRSQRVIHHVVLEGFALLTLLSTWCPGMLPRMLPPSAPYKLRSWNQWVSEQKQGFVFWTSTKYICNDQIHRACRDWKRWLYLIWQMLTSWWG